jgi:CubicO group peptidase (beta-lactamase class C family)
MANSIIASFGRSIALAAMCCQVAPASAQQQEALQRIVGDARDMSSPGCVAGVFRDGKTIFIGAAGSGDIVAGTPLTPDTRFYAASVAKQFTSLAAAKLIEAGKLGLHDDVRKWLPELPEYAAPITVQMLMNHSSGIRDSLTLLNFAGVEDASKSSLAEVLKLMYRQKGTNFVPGTAYSYTNGGYLLLGEVVARAAGKPFQDYVREAIFEPLGMKSTFFIAGRPAPGLVTHGYVPTDKGWAIREAYPAFSGSGGMMLTVNDMARYDHDIAVGHKVWTPAVTRTMLEPGTFSDGKTVIAPNFDAMPYAAGLAVGTRRGKPFFYHLGEFESFRTGYARLPERGVGVAMLCNRSDALPLRRIDELLDTVEPGYLQPYAEYNPPVPKPMVIAPSPVLPVAGSYRSEELDAIYQVAVQGDTVTATITSPWQGNMRRMLIYTRDAAGVLRGSDGGMSADADGRGFTLHNGRVFALHLALVHAAP